MAEDVQLTRLRSSYSRLKQDNINLDRAAKKLKKENKRLIKELKTLRAENASLKRKLREADRLNRKN